ncbi:hypothetical protein XENORESO_003401 [Xenotaenia resolanae]|uniref:Secreted protein n=1 Tax=Xenotaenia resolanae TaxID=208358 RepID=A0ABV0W2C3_9TELE
MESCLCVSAWLFVLGASLWPFPPNLEPVLCVSTRISSRSGPIQHQFAAGPEERTAFIRSWGRAHGEWQSIKMSDNMFKSLKFVFYDWSNLKHKNSKNTELQLR